MLSLNIVNFPLVESWDIESEVMRYKLEAVPSQSSSSLYSSYTLLGKLEFVDF